MTPEQLLLSALSAVTAALVYVARLLWIRSEECEKDRTELRAHIEKLEGSHGVVSGELAIYRRCRIATCPFAESAPASAH